jgi:hypothetical protein
MADHLVSVDEFLNDRKAFVKGTDTLMKAARGAPSWDKEARTARFVMSAEVEDRDRDIILQEGLDVTEFLKNPVAPFSHRSGDFPIGNWQDVEKLLTGRPKRTEGTLKLLPKGIDGQVDRLAGHIEHGSIRACSIGFVPRAVERRPVPDDKKEGYYYPGYKIIEAELVECSPVSVPSNPAALAKAAAEGDTHAREIIEEVLDNWAKHPETGLLVPRAEFEAAFKVATGQRTSTIVLDDLPPELKSVVERERERIAAEEAAKPRSVVRRLLDSVFGDENAAKIDAEIRAKAIPEPEADKVVNALKAIQERADRKTALAARETELNSRLEAKGLLT